MMAVITAVAVRPNTKNTTSDNRTQKFGVLYLG
jgi:hypothetical protein